MGRMDGEFEEASGMLRAEEVEVNGGRAIGSGASIEVVE